MVDFQGLQSVKNDFKLLFEEEKYTRSLSKIEEIIARMESFLPGNDPELQDYLVDFIQNLNAAGMIALERKNFQTAYRCLKKAESVRVSNTQVQSTTYNNLGVYYKQKKKLTTALLYLKKGLQIELKNEASSTLPDIYVNLAAVLSGLGNHHEATMNAMMAIILQQHSIMTALLDACKPDERVVNPERFNVLALGYYNLAVELQHIQKKVEAGKCYETSQNIIKSYNETNRRLSSFLHKTKQTFQSSKHKLPKVLQISTTDPISSAPAITLKGFTKTEGSDTEDKFKNLKLRFENDIEKFRTSYNQRRNSHFNIVVRKHTRNLSKDLTMCKFLNQQRGERSPNFSRGLSEGESKG